MLGKTITPFRMLSIFIATTCKAKLSSLPPRKRGGKWDSALLYFLHSSLERLIGANTPTILLAEHDRYFCENTGTERFYIKRLTGD